MCSVDITIFSMETQRVEVITPLFGQRYECHAFTIHFFIFFFCP